MSFTSGYRETIEEAKLIVLDLLSRRGVLHKAEAMIALEDRFFQWVTGKAIDELRKSGKLGQQTRRVPVTRQKAVFVYMKGALSRALRARIRRKVKLIERYVAASSNAGHFAEDLFQNELGARGGFVFACKETRYFGGKEWTRSDHDLDFVMCKEGIFYGVEVKDVLQYVNFGRELRIKLDMCKYLNLVPFFICRMLPVVWMREIRAYGGVALLFKRWVFPPADRKLVEGCVKEFNFPMSYWHALPQTIVDRAVMLHRRCKKRKHGF